MTTTITQELKSSVEEQKFLSGSDAFKTCSTLLSPLYAPIGKTLPLTDTTLQFDNNMVWESLVLKKPLRDLNEYFNFSKNLMMNESIPNSTSKAFVNPSCINSLYYDHLVNGGGSFNNGSSTKFTGCATDNESLGQQQNSLYSIAFAKPLILSSSSAWSSHEDLTTPTTATTNSTVTSRCSTPATSGWSFGEHVVDTSDPFVAQQQKDTSLKSRSSVTNFHTLKRQPSVTDSSSILFGNGLQVMVDNNKNNITVHTNNKQQPLPQQQQQQQQQSSLSLNIKVRRSSNITAMSDNNSEQSEKSPTIEAEKEQKKQTLYKTEMCRNWEERGSCRYGSKCQFAHSEGELRKVQHHPKYKTEICKTFWQNGTCPYGKRCCFIHNDKERLQLCKRRNSADNVKNSNKKEKSKGLSKFGSDPSLYGSYLSDSNSLSDPSISSPPLMNSAATTPPASNNEFLTAFTDAYFSSNNITLSPETVVASNVSSPSTIHDDDTVIGSANSSVNNTPTKKKSTILSNNNILGFNDYEEDEDDEFQIPSGFADNQISLNKMLNEETDDSIPRFDKNIYPQTRRRASMTSCKLDKSAAKIDLRERSISMSVNIKPGDRVINPSALASQPQSQRRLAIFRNMNRS